MTKKEKKRILILIIVAVIIIGIIIILKNKKTEKQPENTADVNVEEYVEVLGDGTKLNTSTALQESKKIGNLEISNLQLTAKNNATILLGTITNVGTQAEGNILVDIKIIDKQGKELTTLQPLIPVIQPGESKQLNVQTTLDYSNAYNFTVSLAK